MYTCFKMRDEKEERKKQARSNKQTRQSNAAVTFPRKNELPQVGLEPTTLNTLDRALYHMYIILLYKFYI